jgi:hypothetical protein
LKSYAGKLQGRFSVVIFEYVVEENGKMFEEIMMIFREIEDSVELKESLGKDLKRRGQGFDVFRFVKMQKHRNYDENKTQKN